MTDEELTVHAMAPRPDGHTMLEWPGGDWGRKVHTLMHTPDSGWDRGTTHEHPAEELRSPET